MRKFLLLTGIICASVFIQAQDLAELRETARVFTRDGDYSNAILVLNRARQMQPDNLGVLQDLAFNYFLLNDLKNAVDIVRPLVDRKDAEVQTFQVAGSIWKA
ncbi:MAG TPA: tetratricopeptide repeat protein, partial [Parasegetibacter sp.]